MDKVDIAARLNWLQLQIDQLQRQNTAMQSEIDKLLEAAHRPTGFSVKLDSEGDIRMAAAKPTSHVVDQQFLDNGKILVTITPTVNGSATDPVTGNPVVMPAGTPPITCTDSANLLTFAVAPSDTSGFGLIQLGTPSGDTTDDVVTVSTTLAGASAPITGTGDPFDIVPAPKTPSNPTGFAVVDSAAG